MSIFCYQNSKLSPSKKLASTVTSSSLQFSFAPSLLVWEMATWERPAREGRNQQRRKTPSFSSSLLDAIYHSIDESEGKEEQRPEKSSGSGLHRRNNALEVEEEIASLRRAIMIEKWTESYPTKSARGSRRVNSDSSSSTESSFFSSSETESASKSTPKSSVFHAPKLVQTHVSECSDKAMHYEATTPKHEGRFMRTKSRALKIYGDLKKVKQPISPGGKIANFLNSIFTSRNLKKHQGMVVEDWSSVRKSRSGKDTTTCSLTSRSCLNRPPPSSRTNSKRSVRFCPVSVIVDEDCQPCGHKSIYDNHPSLTSMPNISSHYIKKNIDSFRDYGEKNPKKHKYRGFYDVDSDYEDDDDGNSCTSSDLFELENIGMVGIGANREELPVYGTTNLKMNQAIAKGLLV